MAKNLFDLAGKIAVVTGGFGQLGQEYSSALVEAGAKVFILDVFDTPKVSGQGFDHYFRDSKIMAKKCDITNREELEEGLKEIKRTWGVPDILINNAALDSPPNAPAKENGPFETYPEESLDKILDVNIKGTFLCCQVFGGAMAREGKGSIVNISSIYGIVSPNQDIYEYKRINGQKWFKPAPYAVSKSAIMNLTRYLATYWAKKGVRVNTLSPAGIFNNQDKEFLKEYEKRIPIGRMAKPSEMNGAIIFLASDASSYMTGANLVIDGGWTAW